MQENTSKENTKHIRVLHLNVGCLYEFLENCSESLKSFRYFNKRKPEDAIKNHVVTYVIYKKGEAAAYGHLDREVDTVWLGICVADSFIGQGLGREMMNLLVNSYTGTIKLSVDPYNLAAISLYKKFGFKESSRQEDIIFMVRK